MTPSQSTCTDRWVVYSKPDCSLCEAFLHDLSALLGNTAVAVDVIDISASTKLQARYGSRIPVLTIEDEIVCCYRVDPNRVRGHLQGS